jgi:hypothetical protein
MKHETLEENKLYECRGLTEGWTEYHAKGQKLFLKVTRNNSMGVKQIDLYDESGKWITSRRPLLADNQFEIITKQDKHDSTAKTEKTVGQNVKPKSQRSQ